MDDALTGKYRAAREEYKPERVRVLFIAESPPASGGFFYFPETVGKDHLFRETMKGLGLWPVGRRMGKGLDKTGLLRQFQSRGFFLVDTSLVPVDRLSRRRRREMVAGSVSRLAEEARRLDPEHILIVKVSIYRQVRDTLDQAGLADRVLNREPLPFPSHGNQKKFRMELARLLTGPSG